MKRVRINILNNPNKKLSRKQKKALLARIPSFYTRKRPQDSEEQVHKRIQEKFVDQQLDTFLAQLKERQFSKADIINSLSMKDILREKFRSFLAKFNRKKHT